MAGNKRPRKAYRPRYASASHILAPRVRGSTGSVDVLTHLIPHEALNALVQGSGGEREVAVVTFRVNTAYVLATRHLNDGAAEAVLTRALDVLRSVSTRPEPSPLPPEDAEPIGLALTLADDIQGVTTKEEQRRAMFHVAEVAGVPAGTLVI